MTTEFVSFLSWTALIGYPIDVLAFGWLLLGLYLDESLDRQGKWAYAWAVVPWLLLPGLLSTRLLHGMLLLFWEKEA